MIEPAPPMPQRAIIPGAGGDERRFALALAITLVLGRLPGFLFGMLNIDETDYFIIGRMMGAGALPYVGFVEKKPILVYLLYWLGALAGWSMVLVQILALLILLLTCLLVQRTAERWTGDRNVGCAAALIVALTTAANLTSVNAELVMNLFQALALLLCVGLAERPSASRTVAIGVATGLASLCKHQGGILLVAFVLAELRRQGGLVRVLLLGVGFALPWAAVAGVYLGLGHLAEFMEWNIGRNLSYSAKSVGSVLGHFVQGVGLCVALGAPLWWWLAGRQVILTWRQHEEQQPAARIGRTFALVLVLTILPVSMGKRFYEHYFLQFVPALALLAAPGAARLWAQRSSLPPGRRAVLQVLAFAPALLFFAFLVGRGLLRGYPCQEPRTQAVAAWLRSHTATTDRLFVWGHYTPIYFLAQRLPGTRYHNTSVHMGDFDPAHLPEGFDFLPYVSPRDVANTLDDLERNRPRWIVDTAPADIHDWHKIPLSSFPSLMRHVLLNYRHVADPGGAAVYERRDPQPK